MRLERSTDTWDLRWYSCPMCSSATFMYLYPDCNSTLEQASLTQGLLFPLPRPNSRDLQKLCYWNASPGWSSRIPVWGFPKIINHDHFISWDEIFDADLGFNPNPNPKAAGVSVKSLPS